MEPIRADFGREAGHSLDRSVHPRADTNNQTCSHACERKHPEKTHTDTRRTCKLHTERLAVNTIVIAFTFLFSKFLFYYCSMSLLVNPDSMQLCSLF